MSLVLLSAGRCRAPSRPLRAENAVLGGLALVLLCWDTEKAQGWGTLPVPPRSGRSGPGGQRPLAGVPAGVLGRQLEGDVSVVGPLALQHVLFPLQVRTAGRIEPLSVCPSVSAGTAAPGGALPRPRRAARGGPRAVPRRRRQGAPAPAVSLRDRQGPPRGGRGGAGRSLQSGVRPADSEINRQGALRWERRDEAKGRGGAGRVVPGQSGASGPPPRLATCARTGPSAIRSPRPRREPRWSPGCAARPRRPFRGGSHRSEPVRRAGKPGAARQRCGKAGSSPGTAGAGQRGEPGRRGAGCGLGAPAGAAPARGLHAGEGSAEPPRSAGPGAWPRTGGRVRGACPGRRAAVPGRGASGRAGGAARAVAWERSVLWLLPALRVRPRAAGPGLQRGRTPPPRGSGTGRGWVWGGLSPELSRCWFFSPPSRLARVRCSAASAENAGQQEGRLPFTGQGSPAGFVIQPAALPFCGCKGDADTTSPHPSQQGCPRRAGGSPPRFCPCEQDQERPSMQRELQVISAPATRCSC
ncbi:uncharacterized protein LOC142361516 [Opisthocomus hoazin]|uniref:uncharacterized protein LOC142361516 n=1 Tax=Opisthocomus hoazin TaxID=30419 RepID=UPI003F535282